MGVILCYCCFFSASLNYSKHHQPFGLACRLTVISICSSCFNNLFTAGSPIPAVKTKQLMYSTNARKVVFTNCENASTPSCMIIILPGCFSISAEVSSSSLLTWLQLPLYHCWRLLQPLYRSEIWRTSWRCTDTCHTSSFARCTVKYRSKPLCSIQSRTPRALAETEKLVNQRTKERVYIKRGSS